MCVFCTAFNIPACSVGGICAENVHQFLEVLIVSSGASASSIVMWLKGKKKKDEKN